MKYSKPEVEVLGNASALIENHTSKPGSSSDNDGSGNTAASAYDLDE